MESYIHILRERNENKNKVKEKDSFEYESYKEKKRNDKKEIINFNQEKFYIKLTNKEFISMKKIFFLGRRK